MMIMHEENETAVQRESIFQPSPPAQSDRLVSVQVAEADSGRNDSGTYHSTPIARMACTYPVNLKVARIALPGHRHAV